MAHLLIGLLLTVSGAALPKIDDVLDAHENRTLSTAVSVDAFGDTSNMKARRSSQHQQQGHQARLSVDASGDMELEQESSMSAILRRAPNVSTHDAVKRWNASTSPVHMFASSQKKGLLAGLEELDSSRYVEDCLMFESIGEGCESTDKECDACGCAMLKILRKGQVDANVKYAHSDTSRYHRGTAVIAYDWNSFEKISSDFYAWNDMVNLIGKLDSLNNLGGLAIVTVATVDEPFEFWKGAEGDKANAALTAMGMVPTPPNPAQFRGAYAGLGLAGCAAGGSCPTWAGGMYKGVAGTRAFYEGQICATTTTTTTTTTSTTTVAPVKDAATSSSPLAAIVLLLAVLCLL